MTTIKFRRKGLPGMQLYPMLKLATSKVSISLRLLSHVPQDTSKSMCPVGVDDCPGVIPWKVSCIGVSSARLRPISIKVFLIIRFKEAPLSINVLATLCRRIGIFTMKGKFPSDTSICGLSFGLNDILTLDQNHIGSFSLCF
jgi:hypothetical protein